MMINRNPFDDNRNSYDDARNFYDDDRNSYDDGRNLHDDGRNLHDDGRNMGTHIVTRRSGLGDELPLYRISIVCQTTHSHLLAVIALLPS